MMFQKSESTYFDKGSIDAKSALTFEKCPLVAELKLKMSKSHQAPFSISAFTSWAPGVQYFLLLQGVLAWYQC